MRGVIVRTWEQPPSVYELRHECAVLVAGRDFGSVDLSPADGKLVGLATGRYGAQDGIAYLKAVWATYCRGSRLRAEYF